MILFSSSQNTEFKIHKIYKWNILYSVSIHVIPYPSIYIKIPIMYTAAVYVVFFSFILCWTKERKEVSTFLGTRTERRYTCFYWFKLHSHVFRVKKLGSNAARTNRAPRDAHEPVWFVPFISHQKRVQRDQHCMRLFFIHHWSTSMYLHQNLRV